MEPLNQPSVTPEAEITHTGLIGVVLVLVLAIGGVAWYIYTGMQNTPASTEAVSTESMPLADAIETEPPLTLEAKQQILDSLQANPNNLSEADKRAILEQLQQGN